MSQENINLRKATPEDIEIIAEIENNFVSGKTYSVLTDKKEIEEEIKNTHFYLIEEDGKAVGDTSYEMKGKNHAYISGLAVVPEYQGRGIARQAVKIMLEELEAVKTIDLVTHPANEKAIKLYESLGFKKSGEITENYFGDGEPRIKMVLEK